MAIFVGFKSISIFDMVRAKVERIMRFFFLLFINSDWFSIVVNLRLSSELLIGLVRAFGVIKPS